MDGLAEGSEAVWSSVDAQRHAPQFALTAAVGAVRAVITQPELGPQQKREKYRTLPTNMEIPQVSSA
jgi:hypothetical protein